MAVALSICGSALAGSVAAEPAVMFSGIRPFTSYGDSEPLFKSQSCQEALEANIDPVSFGVWVTPANDGLALLMRVDDTFPLSTRREGRMGILDCVSGETSWGISDRESPLDWEAADPRSEQFTEAFSAELTKIRTNPEWEYARASNDVGQSCICSFLASDAWQQYQQDFISDPSNYNAGGN